MRRPLMVALALLVGFGSSATFSMLRAGTQTQEPPGAPLEYIPADTPFVFTILEPIPEDFLTKMKQATDVIWEAYREQLRQAGEEAGEGEEKEDAAAEKEMLEALSQFLSWEGLESIGIDFRGRMAFYGVGLQPVIRWELRDPGKFVAGIARLEEAQAIKMLKRNLDGLDYWQIPGKQTNAYLATVGSSAVATIFPAELESELLPIAFGLEKPSTSLAQSGRLQRLSREHGLLPYGAGYMDVRRMVEIVMADDAEPPAHLPEMVAPEELKSNQACRREVLQIAQAWPILHVGYTSMTAERLTFKAVLQTAPELTRQLQGLVPQVPVPDAEGDGLLAVGLSLRFSALYPFVASQAASFRDNPYQCDKLAGLNKIFEDLESGLAPAPLLISALGPQSVRLVVQSVDFQPGTADLKDLRGYVIMQLENPPAAVEMLQAMVPPLADLNLKAKGEPAAVPAGLLPPFFVEPVVVMSENALALSVGAGNLASLQRALTAAPSSSPPLLSFAYRVTDLFDLVRRQVEAEAAKSNDPDKTSQAEQALKTLRLYDYMRSVGFKLGFTEEGVVLTQTVELN